MFVKCLGGEKTLTRGLLCAFFGFRPISPQNVHFQHCGQVHEGIAREFSAGEGRRVTARMTPVKGQARSHPELQGIFFERRSKMEETNGKIVRLTLCQPSRHGYRAVQQTGQRNRLFKSTD